MADGIVGGITVQVHLDIDVNGEPVTRLLSMPASIEQHTSGMTVHLHLDAAKLAKALLPELVKLIHQQARGGVGIVTRIVRRSI